MKSLVPVQLGLYVYKIFSVFSMSNGVTAPAQLPRTDATMRMRRDPADTAAGLPATPKTPSHEFGCERNVTYVDEFDGLRQLDVFVDVGVPGAGVAARVFPLVRDLALGVRVAPEL